MNTAGYGGVGRIVLEDDDGVIPGVGGGTVQPGETDVGFYRGPFNPSRFAGGGGRTYAVTDLFLVGPFNPTFFDPRQDYPNDTDFIAEIPANVADPLGLIAILVEAQGFQLKPDGTADQTSGTGWRTVGYFEWNGAPQQPRWRLGQINPAYRPSDNTLPAGITNLNTCEYIQLRFTFWTGENATPEDLGPAIDRWTIRFESDQ